MANLAEIIGLSSVLKEAGFGQNSNFEDVYSAIAADPAQQDLRLALEVKIKEYFEDLELPREVTIYDKLILSLRRKDIIATFNWDPFLAQAFMRNDRAAWLPEVVFLHGNVALGACYEHDRKGFFGGVLWCLRKALRAIASNLSRNGERLPRRPAYR
jgi:hypothetical protein